MVNKWSCSCVGNDDGDDDFCCCDLMNLQTQMVDMLSLIIAILMVLVMVTVY